MTKDLVMRVAMKAAIINDGKILILREASTYKEGTNKGRYHMPGGRIEPGEHFEEALSREVREETGLEVKIVMPIYIGEWRPVIHDVPHQIIATFLVCKPTGEMKVVLSDEHDDFQWINPQNRLDFDIMDPEDKVIDKFIELNSKGVFSE